MSEQREGSQESAFSNTSGRGFAAQGQQAPAFGATNFQSAFAQAQQTTATAQPATAQPQQHQGNRPPTGRGGQGKQSTKPPVDTTGMTQRGPADPAAGEPNHPCGDPDGWQHSKCTPATCKYRDIPKGSCKWFATHGFCPFTHFKSGCKATHHVFPVTDYATKAQTFWMIQGNMIPAIQRELAASKKTAEQFVQDRKKKISKEAEGRVNQAQSRKMEAMFVSDVCTRKREREAIPMNAVYGFYASKLDK